jgi:hypothetical protein
MSDDFDFEEGDTVLVRVRQHGTSGRIQAKFVAEVQGFDGGIGPGSDYVSLEPPWDDLTGIRLHSYEAEFEVVPDGQDHV